MSIFFPIRKRRWKKSKEHSRTSASIRISMPLGETEKECSGSTSGRLRTTCGPTRTSRRTNISYPFWPHRPGLRAAFPANDDPSDAVQVQVAHGIQERFDGEKTDRGGGLPQMADSGGRRLIFDGSAAPDMLGGTVWPISAPQIEPAFKGMAGDAPEALGVTMVTASRDLGAVGHQIPGCVRPFDC